MEMLPPQTHLLPSRELSYDYTVAMYFAQQLELNLRAILYTAEYHAFIDIPLAPEEKELFALITFCHFSPAGSFCPTVERTVENFGLRL